MRKQKSLPIFVLCLTSGGLACIASVFGVILRAHDDAMMLTISGVVLFMLASACGVMAATVFRSNCRTVARLVDDVTTTGAADR